MKLEFPSKNMINEYLSLFNKDDRYREAEIAIESLIKNYPHNTSLTSILLKTTVINDLYSTQIFSTFKLAEHIKNTNLDHLLSAGNAEAVDLIARGHGIVTSKSSKEKYLYSFATKYCSWHNQNKYPIYDSFVEKILVAYNNQDSFSDFNKSDLKSYYKFKDVINDFITFYKLEEFNTKQLDKFLWKYGKFKFKI
ncbi:hypothetical protein CEQ90_20500 [Lewinellaceae bacterium SD302]|nr:hypothetical protein CEQ90_20500 [Lewinellaceae bacterium SD302]